MFYSGNPKNPTEYNPVRNIGGTSDLNTLRPIEPSEVFTQSTPGGDRKINGVFVPVVSGERLNISGPSPSYIYGPINSVLTLVGGAKFADGSAAAPSITFIDDPDTGIYRDGSGLVAFTSNSTHVLTVGPNLQTSVPITTPVGQNLALNPSGPSVDFTGHSIINASFLDGSAAAPSITFANDPDTGIYRDGSGVIAVTSNSTSVVAIGSNLQTSVPITTPGGQNLVLNPSGPSVDFTGHSIINAILPGGAAVPRFQVSELEINVVGVGENPIGYVPWRVASWVDTTVQTFYAWVIPSAGTRSLTLRARDNGGAVIGSLIISGGAALGLYSFTITAPVADTRIDFSVQASIGVGPTPKVYGVLLEGT